MGLKKLQHAKLGRINLDFPIFQVAEQPSLRLYLYTPGDERTEIKLRVAVPARGILTASTPTTPVSTLVPSEDALDGEGRPAYSADG
jgi:hypothetical protein